MTNEINYKHMKRNWLRRVIGGLGFTTTLFIFQACYGTPQDFGLDLLIEGQVKSKTSGLPIEGIKVLVTESMQYEITDKEGKFSLYSEALEDLTIKFQDVDSTQNGAFVDKDTVLNDVNERVYLDILLDEK